MRLWRAGTSWAGRLWCERGDFTGVYAEHRFFENRQSVSVLCLDRGKHTFEIGLGLAILWPNGCKAIAFACCSLAFIKASDTP
jgi:hypothetical protein